MTFAPSPQQLAIFNWLDAHVFVAGRKQIQCLIIEALAGTGKSTTLLQGAARLPARESFGSAVVDVLFLAFNKSAVEDLQKRGMPAHSEAKTLNGLGFGAMRKYARNLTVSSTKTRDMLNENLSEADARLFGATVDRLVSIAKSQGLAPKGVTCPGAILEDTLDNWNALIDHFDVDPPADKDEHMPRAIDLARKVLRSSLTVFDVIDFDDQLYVPLMLGLPMPKRFRYVFVDEAQDLNPVQRRLLASVVEPGGVLVAVGDANQAIYGFRGSDNESLSQVRKEYGGDTLPLSVTYRCPVTVVELAQTIVPAIEARDGAPEGEILSTSSSKVDDWSPNDLVVCRTNAPLAALAYALLRKKVPVRIAGRDFGKGLSKLIEKLRPRDIADLLEKVRAFFIAEKAKLVAGSKEHKIQTLSDKTETLHTLAMEADSLQQLRSTIESLFSDQARADAVTLSSVHRAKGAEADRVFILCPELMPLPMAKLAWERQQEENIRYVAVTRAKKTLVMLALDGRSKKAPRPTVMSVALEGIEAKRAFREIAADLDAVGKKHHGGEAMVDAFDAAFGSAGDEP